MLQRKAIDQGSYLKLRCAGAHGTRLKGAEHSMGYPETRHQYQHTTTRPPLSPATTRNAPHHLRDYCWFIPSEGVMRVSYTYPPCSRTISQSFHSNEW